MARNTSPTIISLRDYGSAGEEANVDGSVANASALAINGTAKIRLNGTTLEFSADEQPYIAVNAFLPALDFYVDEGPVDGLAGAFKEVLPTASVLPTSVIWYTDSGKTKKVVEKLLTYTDILPATVTWKLYDTDGVTVLKTAVDTFTYSGIFESTRTRVIT